MTIRRVQPGIGPRPPLVICFLIGKGLDGALRFALGPVPTIIADDSAKGPESIGQLLSYAAHGRAEDPAHAFSGVWIVGFSMGVQRMRGLLRSGLKPPTLRGVIAIDGTHASKPPEPWQIEVWRDLADRARMGDVLFVATHLFQTYVETDLADPYLSTVSVLRLATDLPLGEGGTIDEPVEHHDHGLHVYSYASGKYAGTEHGHQQTRVLPLLLQEHLRPRMVEDDVTPTTPRDPSVLSPLRTRIVAIARDHLGTREDPSGSNDGKWIQIFRRPCVRKGKPLGIGPAPWCSMFASFCIWNAWAALTGEDGPGLLLQAQAWSAREHDLDPEFPVIGYRAAVWELIEDARSCGAFFEIGSGYVSQPGDALCYGRDGQDPRKRGNLGHVAIDIGGGRGVSGNLDDQVSEHDHDLSGRGMPLVGWIRVEA